MFRKPRENAQIPPDASLKPSTGRPPTPPLSTGKATMTRARPSLSANTTPSRRLTGSSPSARKPTLLNGSSKILKVAAPRNKSILNFFKKAEPKPDPTDSGLFLRDVGGVGEGNLKEKDREATPDPSDDWLVEIEDEGESRFSEREGNSKRRRVGEREMGGDREDWNDKALDNLFVGDEEVEGRDMISISSQAKEPIAAELLASLSTAQVQGAQTTPPDTTLKLDQITPADGQDEPDQTGVPDEDGFEGLGDFDEELGEGEEFMERRWMVEEQRQFYLAEAGVSDDMEADPTDETQEGTKEDSTGPSCPICNISLVGISTNAVGEHVNHCLDGDPIPLPQKDGPVGTDVSPLNRFKKEHRGPKPGQTNPFAMSTSNGAPSSAFSKLMSSHTEDAAWANAAAAETASRGKPAYQRTCPFYKIMPGFNICVDAFRYGAVEGCKAYFLSHFHSDHYIGLTSTWEHGPIYCSRVTANLVRQQLRVHPKWVVDLEFEEKSEVPDCNGVDVTMIPANHCPGSSLFLFEKPMGTGKNPRIQRVLHCGDFRACPAHVHHPALRPDILDPLTGKTENRQKIDVCYLDTTYLNPRYAFPCQEEVIAACADMCVSLSKDRIDASDNWEQTKRSRAGDGMLNFIRRDSSPSKIISEGDKTIPNSAPTSPPLPSKSRGRLLVVVGTYSIGKERICVGIARKLGSKIYAAKPKMRICACLEDPELDSLLTADPLEAQVHMTPLFEIRAETLSDYLTTYKSHFSRVVGFRPSGWNYRPPNSRFVEAPQVQTVLHSGNWKSPYGMAELVPQRGSTREASCFGVPYSEHSSFRELTMFCCALRIDKIVPTVNVGSAKSRERMKGWCEKWAMDRKKNGLFKVEEGQRNW
ncbi:MAG: hypothetical protein M1814_004112 [Vezdaea aestivalis]|nr:MAG: hypothetical protein M1814_004112 [Vezdaea aestivalis]